MTQAFDPLYRRKLFLLALAPPSPASDCVYSEPDSELSIDDNDHSSGRNTSQVYFSWWSEESIARARSAGQSGMQ